MSDEIAAVGVVDQYRLARRQKGHPLHMRQDTKYLCQVPVEAPMHHTPFDIDCLACCQSVAARMVVDPAIALPMPTVTVGFMTSELSFAVIQQLIVELSQVDTPRGEL